MKVFDQPDHFPPSLFHIWEYLREFGATSLQDLVGEVAYPEDASTNDDPHVDNSTNNMSPERTVRGLVKVGKFLKIFTEDANKIRVTGQFAKTLDFTAFWHEVRLCVLQYGMNDEENKSHSLPVAIAWYLSFTLEETPQNWEAAQTKLLNDFESTEIGGINRSWIVPNSTQWGPFVRWLTILGFARELPGSGNSKILVPDVSRALVPTVERLPNEQAVPIATFISMMIEDLPCFEGGIVWEQLPDAVRQRSKSQSDVVLAGLRVLESRNIISLETVKDSPSAIPFGMKGESLDQIRKVKPS